MRFATVSEFRGNVMVGIREFYDAGGELKPGKKGDKTVLISVSPEQKLNPCINSSLSAPFILIVKILRSKHHERRE